MRVGVRDFALYKRPRGSGRPVYYVRFRNDDGTRTAGSSTGQTVRALAEAWATAEVRRRKAATEQRELERQAGIPLATFAGADFFSYEGRWALDRRASGKRLSPRQCKAKQQTFDKHVLPVLGGLKLHEINRAMLKDFRNSMFKAGYSASTINRALDCIRAVLEAAEDEGRIPAVPRIDRAAGKNAERGIHSAEEFRRIFALRWEDPRAYLASALAAVTGCRMGEVLALRRSDIDVERLLVSVARSYDSSERVMGETTKNGKTRLVTVPPAVCRGLEMLAAVNPHGEVDPLVFWSDKTPGKPVDDKLIRRELYRAMAQIGIDEAERRRRNLGFHGFRHGLNTALLEAHVPPEKVRMVTGHSSSDMTLLYYHAQVDAMSDVRAVQARMMEGVRLVGVPA
jgi:integrase